MSRDREAWAKWLAKRSPVATTPAPPKKPPRRESKLEATLAFQLGLLKIPFKREYRFDPERRWRFDFAFLEHRLAVEINGGIYSGVETGADGEARLRAGRHSRAAGMLGDMDKCNAAVEQGWRVLTFGPPHISSGVALTTIERVLTASSASSPAVSCTPLRS
jgi:very-short-patch-repair endonuclease